MTSEENIHSESNNTWTLVTRRRRRAISALSYIPQATYSSSRVRTPSPWTPTDSSADPERESKLLRRMQSSIRRLEKSRFFRRFLCRMRSPLIQECLDKLLVSCSRIQIVAYGIGSIESYEVPRLQLALAILLMQELGVRVAGSIEVFDPILSSVECAVVAALGCTVVSVDEGGRREATVPTLFYMPHCELVLYDSLLEANWKPAMLKRLVVLGNSFGVYERCANERVGAGSVSLEVQEGMC
ncbi:hypothetical protein HPP92_000706 [Vanilla planifolia]|uniref:SRR1-like domain-containing protein n=1 Tax=Vanilla planifolia TaxID=51239 RepID=A0A835VGC8_VANPL|nr:hypothetical protein HPP92_000706 [Vanilla planifolia]